MIDTSIGNSLRLLLCWRKWQIPQIDKESTVGGSWFVVRGGRHLNLNKPDNLTSRQHDKTTTRRRFSLF